MNRLFQQDMPQFLRRHRYLILGGAAAFLVAILVLFRRGRGPSDDEAPKPVAAAASDSVVSLDSAARALVAVELTAAQPASALAMFLNGTITFDENRVSVVAPRVEGRVVAVKSDLGQHVARGSVLALIESSEVGAGRGEIEKNRAALDVAKANYEREKRLFEQSVSSQKEMLDAQAEYLAAVAEFNSSISKIRSLGAIGGNGATYALTSPISGVIVERTAMPGQIAGPTTNLFTVADLSRVWISVDVYESDANRVHSGTPAVVSARSLPGETFPARVTYAGGVVDTATHTVKLRLDIPNPGGRLRPGMFAEVKLDLPQVGTVSPDKSVVIPEDAIQDVNGRTVVFIPLAKPGQFVVRNITTTGTSNNHMTTVTAGLRAGERVVVKGAFQLKAELTKGAFGDDDG